MISRIDVATTDDLSAIIASADAPVAPGAGRYDPAGTDLAWAARSGSASATGLSGSSDNLVPLARDGDPVIGHLVARLEFLARATGKGAERVSVTAYAADSGAQRFYARHGFVPRSVVLDRDRPGASASAVPN